MASQRLVPASVREALLGIPSDIASLERNSEHIVLTGDYDWNSGAAVRTHARPLNLYPARVRA